MNAISKTERGHVSPALTSFLSRGWDEAASERLRHAGLPTRRDEAWRYTPLASLDAIAFGEAPACPAGEACCVFDALAADCVGPRAVFVNGHFLPARSSLPDGVEVVEKRAVQPSESDHPLAILNGALSHGGVSIRVPAGVDAGVLSIVSLSDGKGAAFSTHLRHDIMIGEGARLVVRDVQSGRGQYLSNPVFTISVADGGVLTHVKLQHEALEAFHLALVVADVAEGGTYDNFTLTLGARLARHEVSAALNGQRAAVHVNGAQLLDGQRHADLTSLITHAAPHCDSRQTVKNVIMDSAHGVFQGKIHVHRVAQKTDGYQMNQALLLSERAQIDSKPELEIYADDVKCSHGATVGALDDEQFFYLRSRGIPTDQARSMLVRAFLLDAIELVTDEALRDWLDQRLDAWWTMRGA